MRVNQELTERELDEVTGGDCGFGVCLNPMNGIAIGAALGGAEAGRTQAAVQKAANAIVRAITHRPA